MTKPSCEVLPHVASLQESSEVTTPPAEFQPSIIHVLTKKLSIIFDLSNLGVPQIRYWGSPLTGASDSDIAALVVASRESPDGNQPERPSTAGLVPLESDWWPARPALVGFREGGVDWTPRFTLSSVKTSTPSTAGQNQFDYSAHIPTHLSASEHSVATVSAGHIVFELFSASSLQLAITVDAFPEGPFRIQCALTNQGQRPYHLQELGVVLPLSLEANEILDTTGRWGKERTPQRRMVHIGCDLREMRHGRTGFDAPGFTFVGPQGFTYDRGPVWGFHTAWSGNHRTWVDKTLAGMQVVGGSEILEPGEVTLQQGDTYETPWFYACHGQGLDDVARQIHRWMRQRPNHPRQPRPVTLNVWEAVYFNQNQETLTRLAQRAAAVGVERFVLDDGWFLGRRNDYAGLGDWFVDPQVWPDGLTPLVDFVHDQGMQFGLWFEPEMINEDSHLARTHPDWILAGQGSSRPEDLPVRWRHQQALNLSIPAAYAYVRDRLNALVRHYDIAFIKWDHNRDLVEAGSTPLGGRAVVSEQTRALYRLIDEVKVANPGLEIEACASGGGRVDLEILQHTDRFWASDCIDPVERVPMMNWYSQIAPPELLGAHVASPLSHTTGRTSPLSMRAGTAIWGSFGMEWNLLEASEAELAELAEWVSFYQKNRAFLHTGDQVRCPTPDQTLYLHGVVAPDRSRALYQLVTHDRSAISPRGALRFGGLDPRARYRLRPVIIGEAPAGLIAPPWFSGPVAGEGQAAESGLSDADVGAKHQSWPGIVTTGEVLNTVGVQVPRMYPDQSLLFEAIREIESDKGVYS